MKSLVILLSLFAISIHGSQNHGEDFLNEIVQSACGAVEEEEIFTSSKSQNCYAVAERLMSERDYTTTGDFIIKLCDSLPAGGLFTNNYQRSCLIAIARDSDEPTMQAIFRECSEVAISYHNVDGAETCFRDLYKQVYNQ